jgi:hypothetical protein
MRSNRQLTLDGVTKCMAEWVEDLGIPPGTRSATASSGAGLPNGR